MSGRILLFVAPDCPKCHEVVRGMVDNGILYEDQIKAIRIRPLIINKYYAKTGVLEIFDSGTVDGLAASAFHNVRSVPTLIFMRDGDTLKRVDGGHKEIAEMISLWARGEKIY